MRDTLTILYYYYRAKRLMQRFTTRDQLLAWQQKQLHYFMHHVLKNSPFYQPFCGMALSDYPLMNKAMMMQHFDHLNTMRLSRDTAFSVAMKAEHTRDFSPLIGDISVGLSSGTSGSRGLFAASAQERLMWAGIMLAKSLDESLLRHQKIAFFLRANNHLYQTLAKRRHIEFHFFDLLLDMEDHIAALNHVQPTVLVAPATILKLLAASKEAGKLRISPRKIFSVAEVLDEDDKAFISHAFDKIVHQIYQCTEGFLGITRSDGTLYLNEEYVHIEKEWIDKETGRFVPIITDFSRTTQPIIRYRLDDVLVEDRENSSPFTCLTAIEGRCDDICYVEAAGGGLMPVFAEVLRQVITASGAWFEEYRIIQHAPAMLEIQLQPSPSEDAIRALGKALEQFCARHHYHIPALSFAAYEQYASHSKHKRIERRYDIAAYSGRGAPL